MALNWTPIQTHFNISPIHSLGVHRYTTFLNSALQSVYCTLTTAYCKLYSIHLNYKLHITLCLLDLDHFTLHIVNCTLKTEDCFCIMTRGGIHGEKEPEHEGNPEGGARRISRGLRLYFTVYPELSHNADILNF